jgi:DnaJ-class molecular chaperone
MPHVEPCRPCLGKGGHTDSAHWGQAGTWTWCAYCGGTGKQGVMVTLKQEEGK